MQIDYFKLDILSPVHIGTGDELDPMNYLLREEADGVACYVLDTQAWAGDHPDPKELSELFSSGNVPAMRGFLVNKIDPDIYGLRRIAVSSKRIFQQYEKKLTDQSTTNQLLFSPHMTTSNCVPLLPGSSIKGALRTAVIDWLDLEKHLRLKAARAKDNKGDAYRKQLESVLGPVTNNAFKQLKISDVTGYSDSTVLVEPLEIRAKEGKAVTPKNKCEVMTSRLMGKTEESVLYARIALGAPNMTSDRRLTLRNGKSWNWFDLAKLVNGYYLKRFQDEKNKFYNLSNFAQAKPAIEQLEAELRCNAGQMILRVGHYSQVEFITVQDNNPFTKKGKQGTPLPYGTTRTLANGRLPFGWIRLTPCSEVEYLAGITLIEKLNLVSQKHRKTSREKVLLDRKRQLEQIRKREETARQQAEAEAHRKAELDALPDEERQVLLLERGELNENEVVALYNQIDNMEVRIKLRTAKVLKKYWQKEGKWHKKKMREKQLEKVSKVKSILGEI